MFCRRSHIVHFITSLLFIVVGSVHAQTDSLMRVLEEEGVTFTSNNRIVFFDNGQAKFDDLFKAVAQAKSSVHMEYFNFRDDSIANALFELLAKKVAEGVEVRLLYDAFGNASNNRPIKKKKLKAMNMVNSYDSIL